MSGLARHDDASAHAIATESPSLVLMAVPTVIIVGCATVAVMAPISVSIAAVFLFAGPHNWMEARYFLTRMPARWGSLAPYFTLGLIGSLFLTAMFVALPSLAGTNSDFGLILIAVWNSLLTLWIIGLARLRCCQNPRRKWPFLIPIGLGMIAANWLLPLAWSLALVFLHPLLALAFLDRELQRHSLVWWKSFRWGLQLIPVCLCVMAVCWATGPDISGHDLVTWQITHHAGAGVIPGISTHFLVAAHVFLELLHYLIWIVVMPLTCRKNSIWSMVDVPLSRRSPLWRRLVMMIVALGAAVVVLLWASFLTDYAWTRDIYFTIAILHVLMEIPFLLRSL